MSSAGDIVTNLTANTTDLVSGLEQGKAEVKKFSDATTALLERTAKAPSVSTNLNKAQNDLASLNTNLSRGLKKSQTEIAAFAGSTTALLAKIAAPIAGIFAFKEIVSSAREALQSQQKLRSILASTGGAAGKTAEQITELAESLQKTTNFDADGIVDASAVIASFGTISGENFTRTIELSTDLAAKMGTALPESAKKLAAALSDPIAGMGSLKEAGVVFTAAQKAAVEQMVKTGDVAGAQKTILDALGKSFGGTAKAVADPFVRLQNTIGDVGEAIGGFLLPTIDVLANQLSAVAEQASGFGSTFVDAGIEAASVIQNLGGVFELAGAKATLFVTQVAAEFEHVYTGVIPAFTEFFLENFTDIMQTAANFTVTAFINLGHNIQQVWQGVLDFISGNPVNVDLKPLTQSFHSAIKAIPNVPQRLVSDFEQTMIEDVNRLTDNLGQSIQTEREKLEKIYKPTITTTAPQLPGADNTAAAQAAKGPQLAAERSSEALSSIFANLRGANKKDPQEQGNKIAQDQLQEQRRTNDLLQRRNDTLIAGTI
jgi:hypothetical protein